MLRRLYFLVPHPTLAVELVGEIEQMGVDRDHIHALVRDGIDLAARPDQAAQTQRGDIVWKVEWDLWEVNLACFGLALVGFMLALTSASTTWAVLTLAVMVISCVLATLLIFMVPAPHLDELSAALAQGEVLLMVDVPKRRVLDIESWIDSHHPEAVSGGIGWTTEHLRV